MSFLSGYKTYIVGLAAFLGARAGYLQHTMTLDQAIQLATTALIGICLRAGIASSSK